MNRRQFLVTSACASLAAAAVPAFARQSLSLGAMRIDTLADGYLTLPADFLFEPMPQEDLARVLAEHGLARDADLTPPCNVTLLRHEDRVVLFDAGAGGGFQPTAGALAEALDTVGVAPDEVTHVVFTHGHPDHLWGVLDDFDDPVFPEAEHMMGRVEWDYWRDPATVDTIGAARAAFAVGALRRLEAIENRITLFDDGEEILPGIAARASHGHTPGHMAFELRDGSEALMVVGDAIGNPHVAFARPDWPSGSDQDREAAAATRTALLDQLAADRLPMIGFHLPDGGMGRVERRGDAYRLAPLEG